MNIEFTEALWVLGLLEHEKLSDFADEALKEGFDSPELRMLSELFPDDYGEINELFGKTLRSFGRGNLTKRDAAKIYAKAIAAQILKGELDPYTGAVSIWDASLKVADPKFHDLDPFIYAASEYEDRPDDREFFIQEIKKYAQDIVP